MRDRSANAVVHLVQLVIVLTSLSSPPIVFADEVDREIKNAAILSHHEGILTTADQNGDATAATSAAQWRPRRAAILSRMQSVMGQLPETNSKPPVMTVLESLDCGTYERKKITYRSEEDCETPAYLCVPKSANEANPAPAILCLHPTDNRIGHDVVVGLGGKANRQYASELAERGYVTLSPSYPLLAGYQPDLSSLGWESGTLKAVWDNVRGIDLLVSLPAVRDNAIGAIGHSLGGHNAVYTAVFDERIRVIVSSCGLDSYRDYYRGDRSRWLPGNGWTQSRYMPRLAQYIDRLDEIPFDFDELLAALAPRHTLVIAPLHDSNFQAQSVDRVAAEARKVFELHGKTDNLRVVHPDCGHDFPAEMRHEAYELFDDVLRSN